MSQKYKWTRWLSLLTPLLVIIALAYAGAGHGTIVPSIVIFPFGSLAFLGSTPPEYYFFIPALVQYPVYGLVIDRAKSKKKYIIPLLIIFIHSLLVLMVLMLIHSRDNLK